MHYKTGIHPKVLKSQTISWASLVKQFALQRSRRHAVSVFEANKCRVS